MILAENCHLKSALNMVSETVQLSHFKNDEAENSFQERKDRSLHQGSSGRQRNICPLRASSCLDAENSGKVIGISSTDTERNKNVDVEKNVLPVSIIQALLSSS